VSAVHAETAVRDDVDVRLYRPGDEEAIIRLRSQVDEVEATDKNSLRHWRHEMRDNPAGRPVIPTAMCGGRVVSHVVMQPRKLHVLGSTVLAHQWIDVMTHSDFRGRGLLTRVEQLGEAEALRRGCAYFLGFPNKRSFGPYVGKYGASVVGPLTLLVRPHGLIEKVLPDAACTAMRDLAETLSLPGRDRPRSSRIEEIDRFDPRFDRSCERFHGEYAVLFDRSVEHLNWRYVDVPGRTYRLYALHGRDGTLGFVIYRLTEHKGIRIAVLMDLWTGEDPARSAGFVDATLAMLSSAEGPRTVFAMFSRSSWQYEAALRAGFTPVPRSLNPYGITQIGKTTRNWRFCPAPAIADETSWYVSFGDNDIF
jgi:hypothetical protein